MSPALKVRSNPLVAVVTMISPDGSHVVFLTRNINLPLANFTSSQVYLVPFTGSRDDTPPINPLGGSPVPPAAQGASPAPTFSKDGSTIAYLQMNGIAYESDRSILYVADANPSSFNVTALACNWDRSPDQLAWSNNGNMIYVAAADLAQERIFAIPVTAESNYKPTNPTHEGVIAGYSILPNGNILISDSKIWSSQDIYSITPDGTIAKVYVQANLVDAALSGLSPADVSEVYFSSNSTEIKPQSWIIYPSNFDPNKTYLLCFIVHGCPQGAHPNSWSTR